MKSSQPPHHALTSRGSPGLRVRAFALRFSPEQLRPQTLKFPGMGQGKSSWPPLRRGCGRRASGIQPGSRRVPATGRPRTPTPWGLGKGRAAPPCSPSDGEMWPFTHAFQCQPLNHCLRACAQGYSPSRPTKPPPPPPGTSGAEPPLPPPRPRGREARSLRSGRLVRCAPAAFLSPSVSVSPFVGPKALSPGRGIRRLAVQTHQETSSSSLPYGKMDGSEEHRL